MFGTNLSPISSSMPNQGDCRLPELEVCFRQPHAASVHNATLDLGYRDSPVRPGGVAGSAEEALRGVSGLLRVRNLSTSNGGGIALDSFAVQQSRLLQIMGCAVGARCRAVDGGTVGVVFKDA